VFAEQVDINRVQALYPRLNQKEASDFIYRLPGRLLEGRVEITRLENELNGLINDLSAWTANVPAVHPVSGTPLTPQELLEEHSIRDQFKTTVERCWRRQSELDQINEDSQPTYELNLPLIITGDLPTLRADFSHVSALFLESRSRLTSGAGGFLESFPHLKELSIGGYRLGDIPGATFRMGRLTRLILSDCELTLTAQSALELAQMERLTYLDLSNNPLGRTPDVSQMPHLLTLLLDDTGISELPEGLFRFTDMETMDLSSNAITHVPADILEMPVDVADALNLRNNPLSEESVQRLIAYFQQKGVDFGVEEVIEHAEMEVSTSEGSDVDE
jgi:Leucine-rich repeat (LRR) protein